MPFMTNNPCPLKTGIERNISLMFVLPIFSTNNPCPLKTGIESFLLPMPSPSLGSSNNPCPLKTGIESDLEVVTDWAYEYLTIHVP